MGNQQNQFPARSRDRGTDEIDPKELVLAVVRRWKGIFLTAFSFAVVAAFVSFFILVQQYESSATIMAPTDNSSSGGLRGLTGNIPFAGLLNIGGRTQEMQRYEEILRSRSLVVQMIREQNWLSLMNPEVEVIPADQEALEIERLYRRITKATSIDLGTSGSLKIAFRHPEPEMASKVVEAYLRHLQDFVGSNTLTQAKATELFIEERLKESESELKKVEEAYLNLQRSRGVVELGSQARLSLNTVASLRAQLIEKEMEIELFRDVVRDSSEIQRLEAERRQIQSQMDRLVQRSNLPLGSANRDIDIFTPLSEVPDLEMAFATAERDYRTQVQLVNLLRQQLEVAKIETKKNEPLFQIIDAPVPGVIPVAPNRRLNTIVAFLVGGMLAMFVVVVIAQFKIHTPVGRRKLSIELGGESRSTSGHLR